MSKLVRKEVCKCENCGNEAEMVVTCSLPDVETADGAGPGPTHRRRNRILKNVSGDGHLHSLR